MRAARARPGRHGRRDGGLWLLQRRTGNAGVVDVGWSAGVGVVGVLVAALGVGWAPRRWLVGAMIAAWSLRLAIYILRRVLGEARGRRYTRLRTAWGGVPAPAVPVLSGAGRARGAVRRAGVGGSG